MSQVNGPVAEQRSGRSGSSTPFQSSHNESFTEDPDFGSSDTSSEEGEHVVNISQQHDSPEVTIVWKELQVVSRRLLFDQRRHSTRCTGAVCLEGRTSCSLPDSMLVTAEHKSQACPEEATDSEEHQWVC